MRKTRLLVLVAVLVAVGAASWFLQAEEAAHERRAQLPALMHALVLQGEVGEAARLMAEVHESFPEDAPADLLELNYLLRYRLGNAVARPVLRQLHAGGLGPVAPAIPPVPEETEPIEGSPGIAYLSGPESVPRFATLLPDVLEALGKGQPAAMAPGEAAPPGHVVVVAPDPALIPPAAASLVVLGPNPAAEALMGLTRSGEMALEGCRLHASGQELALGRLRVPVPHSGRFIAYHPGDAEVLATLHCGAESHPAILRRRKEGATRTLFSFNLLEELLRWRQGDPAQAGIENDQIHGLRPTDLFTGSFTEEDLAVPFADLVMQSLIEIIEAGSPALRLWHHPGSAGSTLIVTADQDFCAAEVLETMMAMLRQADARATFFLTSGSLKNQPGPITSPSRELAARARSWGMDLGIHPDLGPEDRVSARDQVGAHANAVRDFYGLPSLTASRFHLVAWRGFTTSVDWVADAGIRYELSYLTVLTRRVPTVGYMTGSSLPLRYHRADGTALPVIQLATQLDDHPNPRLPYGPAPIGGRPPKLSRADYVRTAHDLLRGSVERYHSPVILNNHPLQFFSDPHWLLALVDEAKRLGAPVLSVADYDAFLQGFRRSRLAQQSDGSYHAWIHHERQDVILVNAPTGGEVQVDGAPAKIRTEARWGRSVGVLSLRRGRHEISLGAR